MGTNVRSNLWLCNRVIPGMAERGGGTVILVSSIAAFKGDAALGAYAVSKAAEIQLVRSLAVEWGPAGVRVNAIAPGARANGLRPGPCGRTTPAGRRANGSRRFAGSASRRMSRAQRCSSHRVPGRM